MVPLDLDPTHKGFICFLQIVSGITLVVQWRTGNPMMFVGRGFSNWAQALVTLHSVGCGKEWFWDLDACEQKYWHDERRALKIIHIVMVLRNFLNGCSLFCQCHWPQIMFLGHGNLQLFLRGGVQSSGIILHSMLLGFKESFRGTEVEARELDIQLVFHTLRIILVTISAWSLFHQWWYTGKGQTGHKVSDLHEHLRRVGHSTWDAIKGALRSVEHAGEHVAHQAKESASHAKECVIHATEHVCHAGQVSPHLHGGHKDHQSDQQKQIVEDADPVARA